MKTNDVTGGILPGEIMPPWSPISIGDWHPVYRVTLFFNPLPHMPILGFSNSAANIDMMS